MDREPTLWERQLQKQTATGVEAALAALEKRPVVATCTTPPAPASSSRPSPRRARPLAFVVVRADAFRTARELAALAAPRRRYARAAAEAVADDGFAEIARAAPDDEAVALALREALPRKPASAPAGDADAAAGRPCRKWLDATAATVRPRDAPPRLCVLPGAAPRPWTCAGRARRRRAEAPWLALSLRDRGGGDGDDDAVAAALHFVAVAPGRRPPPVVVYVENGERAERLAARLAAELAERRRRRRKFSGARGRGAARGAPKHAVAAALAEVEIAPERLAAPPSRRPASRGGSPRGRRLRARGGLEAYESLAAPAFDGGEAVACHVLGDEPFWDRLLARPFPTRFG
ncbi:hypothetical protein JL720_11968 [Aureococcus anophagefferens]|nr:hypothetical protein JL720_11968 [Aureococcus anophagefferens]